MASDKDALRELESISDLSKAHLVQHYLYFPLEQTANNVAHVLSSHGYSVECRLGADGVNWLVLARIELVPTEAAIAAARSFLEEIAIANHGEYDGWEAEVPVVPPVPPENPIR